MKAQMYYKGELISEWELEPLVYPKLHIISHDLTDYLVFVRSYKGDYFAKLSGTVWRVCGENYCYTRVFPTKEAAEEFVESPMMFGGYGYDRLK